ncbi:hypothetical protein MtrunA17_Chr7g0252181 [Medicago truncatula]|uniref:Transmembrane protein n=1 Tax=Medicago truncatula TaxID=3880 RepID=A0A396H1X3_MEDTR|nr:hypothetical protein MtrunA17_Chr7g0252181 [Medicago truncatula]
MGGTDTGNASQYLRSPAGAVPTYALTYFFLMLKVILDIGRS